MKKIIKTVLIIGAIVLVIAALFSKDVDVVKYSDPEYDTAIYWPVPGHYKLSQGFHSDSAIDVGSRRISGAPIHAAVGGTVTKTYHCRENHEGEMADCSGYGTGVVIAGEDGRTYCYAHMTPDSIPIDVYEGAEVNGGQMIGTVGNTGNSSGPHLHFGIFTGQGVFREGVNPAEEIYKDVY